MFVKQVQSLDGKIKYPKAQIYCKIGGGERLEITYDYELPLASRLLSELAALRFLRRTLGS